mmetsp:Transcript_25807/g.44465  ORF Transcript_25807/g.44465 Transcript_25807/m.44465 type:complete len:220 (+) Transcript_25807:220-879(+)
MLAMTTAEPVNVPDIEDDLKREVAFYQASLEAVSQAIKRLDQHKIPHRRPDDYFAECVKTDEQIRKIKTKLLADKGRIERGEQNRKQREMAKYGKQVQLAKQQQRAKSKKENIDNITKWRKQNTSGRADPGELEDLIAAKSNPKKRKFSGPSDSKSPKNSAKNRKYGFGGPKRHQKSNTASSTSDMQSFKVKRQKQGPQSGKKGMRPGKSKRQKMRSNG